MKKTILIVAMSESIHTARWTSQIVDQGWDIHIFPSGDYGIVHPELNNVSIYHSFYGRQDDANNRVRHHGIPLFSNAASTLFKKIIKRLLPPYRTLQLARFIQRSKPDIIHSLEIQHAGYLTIDAKKLIGGHFPKWIVTNWGSDIYLFGRLSEHVSRIKEVLNACDYYSCECQRDVCLAEAHGLKGKVLPVFPNTGGFNLQAISRLRQKGAISERRLIMLKGYQGWSGRALVGLRALERCKDMLKGYEVATYSLSPEATIAIELFSQNTGVRTTIIPSGTPHQEILRYHGRARISIGMGISDAISTSLLEAMVMGSFPIQSWTSCADEWIEDGTTGLLVPPDDPDVVEKAIRRALSNDELVDRAAELNWKLAQERLDERMLRQKAIDLYSYVYNEGK